jgi:hypothetical protein
MRLFKKPKNIDNVKEEVEEKKDTTIDVLEQAVGLLVSLHHSPPREYSRPEYSDGYLKLLPHFINLMDKYKEVAKPEKPENYDIMKKSGLKNIDFAKYDSLFECYEAYQNILKVNKWCVDKFDAYGFITINDLNYFIQSKKVEVGPSYGRFIYPFSFKYLENVNCLNYNQKVAEDILKFKRLKYKPDYKINPHGWNSGNGEEFFRSTYQFAINSSMKKIEDIKNTDKDYQKPGLFVLFQVCKENFKSGYDNSRDHFNYLILYPVFKFNTSGFAILTYSEKLQDLPKDILDYTDFSDYISRVILNK